jgi:iron complex outermembrane recepter protein
VRSRAPLAALLAASAALDAAGQVPVPVPGSGADSVFELPAIDVVVSILHAAGPTVGSGVPARTASVGRDEIDAREPRHLLDILDLQPGISLYDDLGSPFKRTMVVRGFAASPVVGLPQGISVFVDGVPVNEPDAGQVNFDLLPLAHVERVEVLSGTASLLGPHSLGGAVNLVTRRGAGPPSGEVELGIGSHGARSVEATTGGSAGGWSYHAGGGYATEDGWRQQTSATQRDALASVGRLGVRRGLRLQAFASRSRAETAGSLPLSVYSVRPDSNLSAGDFEDLSQVHVALSGYAPVGGGRGSFRAWLRGHDAERFNVNQVHDPDVRAFSRNRTLGGGADWTWAPPAHGGTVSLRAGAGGSVNRVGIRILAERIDPGLTTDVESPIAEAGAYSLVDLARGRVSLTGVVRADAVRIPFRNRLDPARDTTSLFVRLSPRAGVRVALAGGASLHGSVGESFRAPAVIELACADPENPCPLPFALGDDPPLDPVIVTTLEVGAGWTRGRIAAAATLYRTRVRNDIFLFPYHDDDEPEGSTIDGYFANVRRTRREGAEVDARAVLRGGHALFASYALTRATFQVGGIELFSIRAEAGGDNEVEPGDRLPLTPTHTARAGGRFALSRAASAGIDGRYTGARTLRGDEANREPPLDPHVVADVHAEYRSGAWRLHASVTNVLQARYAAYGTFNLNQGAGSVLERFLTPSSPRSFRLVLARRFGG